MKFVGCSCNKSWVVLWSTKLYILQITYVEREGFIEPIMGADEICLNGDWSTPIIPYLGNQVFIHRYFRVPSARPTSHKEVQMDPCHAEGLYHPLLEPIPERC